MRVWGNSPFPEAATYCLKYVRTVRNAELGCNVQRLVVGNLMMDLYLYPPLMKS